MAARRLNTYVTVAGVTYPPGEVPADVAAQIDAPGVFEDDGSEYSSMKVGDLRAEIERRNEGRDDADLVPSDGPKADLVAALEADDGK